MTAGTEGGIGAMLAAFVFGTANRLLIPFGLHHLLNSIPWFQLGQCETADGGVAHGDLTCFFSGVNGSNAWTGSFMTGFFPIMMFALPAAALAIWHTAKPAKRKATGALMVSVALTAFITGITEPLEYAFAYVAFPIYAVHAVLTGTSLALVNALGIKDGFSFSAGAIDYVLNFGKSAELSGGAVGGPLLLVVIGLVYAVIYYFLFRFLITKFDFKTPGREDDDVDSFKAAQAAAAESTGKNAEAARKRWPPPLSCTTTAPLAFPTEGGRRRRSYTPQAGPPGVSTVVSCAGPSATRRRGAGGAQETTIEMVRGAYQPCSSRAWTATTRRVSSRFSLTMRRKASGASAWEASHASSAPTGSTPSSPTVATDHSRDRRFSAMWKVREAQMASASRTYSLTKGTSSSG